MCVSLPSDSSETVEAIIIKLGTVTASSASRVNYITLTFIQGHTDLMKMIGLIISETVQAMPIRFAVKIV